jgi:hypothetical protein
MATKPPVASDQVFFSPEPESELWPCWPLLWLFR